MEGNAKLNQIFLVWWYGEAYHRLLAFAKHFMLYLTDLFSVKVCLRTMFAPWRRDQISYAGLSIQDRFQVATLNLVSRLVGALVKILTLATFVLVFLGFLLLWLIFFLLWFCYPLLILALIIYGLKIMVAS